MAHTHHPKTQLVFGLRKIFLSKFEVVVMVVGGGGGGGGYGVPDLPPTSKLNLTFGLRKFLDFLDFENFLVQV